MFVRLNRVLDESIQDVSVNTEAVTWARQMEAKRVLLKMSDGPDMTVVGTLEEVERKLNCR